MWLPKKRFWENKRVMLIPPTIFHLKILMVRLTTQEYYNTQRHEHTSCKNIYTQMNIKQFLQPNTHASWCEGRTWVLECFISWMFSLRGQFGQADNEDTSEEPLIGYCGHVWELTRSVVQAFKWQHNCFTAV